MATATARHILVETEELCNKLKNEINSKETTFEKAAQEFSQCPSSRKGGDLGEFSNGQMVPEFDKVIFRDELNTVHGPVKTSFGFHLIEITSRNN